VLRIDGVFVLVVGVLVVGVLGPGALVEAPAEFARPRADPAQPAIQLGRDDLALLVE
jgi:hypothetical protein